MKNASPFTVFQPLQGILTREVTLPKVLRHEGRLERLLILLHALVALLIGYGLFLAPEHALRILHLSPINPQPGSPPGVRLAGALLAGLAVTLLCLLPMTAPEVRRRIAVGFFVTSSFLFLAQVFVLLHTGSSVTVMIVISVLFGAALLLAGRLRVFAGWTPFSSATRDLQKKWQEQIREAAAQQERNRLARDLHDSIKQQIFSVRLASATAEARLDSDLAGAREALAHVRKSAQEAAVEMQALLHQLRPEPLANVGLVEALREQCESLGYRTSAQVAFEVGELPADEQLPPAAQEALFRVAQEALANVARHSRAAQVQVRLGREVENDASVLVLEVRDDGQGFDAAQEAPGMGLRGMKDRLRPFGGSLEVESATGSGTRILARLLVAPAEEPRPQAGETREEVTIRRIKGDALLGGILMFTFQIVGQPDLSLSGFAYFVLIYGSFHLMRMLRARFRSVAAATAVARLFTLSTVFWSILGFWKANPETFRFLAEPATLFPLAGLALALMLIEASSHSRRLRGAEKSFRGSKLVPCAFLLGVATSLPFFFLAEPLTVARTCVIAASLFYIAWWVWDSLQGEPS